MANIDLLVRRHAENRPDRLAVVGPTKTLTWSALDAAGDRAAAFLAERGGRPGSRVGWLGANDAAYVILLLGARRRRAILAGLNWRLPPAELRPAVEIAAPQLMIADTASAELASAVVDGRRDLHVLDGTEWTSGSAGSDAVLSPGPDEPALMIFTSGSTSAPKGVVLSRDRNDACWTAPMPFDLGIDSTALIIPPVFHIAGSAWVHLCLAVGATQVFASDAGPGGLVRAINEHAVTDALMVPTIIKMVVDELTRQATSLPSLRHIAYGSAPIPLSLLRSAIEVLGCESTQAYGMTEVGGVCAMLPSSDHVLDGPRPERLGAAGVPHVGLEVKAVERGQILIRSPYMMEGYWQDPARTSAVLDGDGWLHSGDLGHLDADGYLYVVGRTDDMIISGGENVYPAEVERAIAEIPGVLESAVFGVDDEHWGQRVRAAVVTDGTPVTSDERSPSAATGSRTTSVRRTSRSSRRCPRTPTGKIAKGALRGQAQPVGEEAK